ncbi:MAG: hypothetical protein RMK31_06830, partial [Candidatus Caldarchaeum sp.]|nr:hypothetical protein [Candidatus Caldarchaeum sp.]
MCRSLTAAVVLIALAVGLFLAVSFTPLQQLLGLRTAVLTTATSPAETRTTPTATITTPTTATTPTATTPTTRTATTPQTTPTTTPT